MRSVGRTAIVINCNPETVSTDYDVSDRLYFEPLTLEDVLEIYHQEKCDGAIVQYGGQTPLNLASGLQAAGVNVIGTSPESIDDAEDREKFKDILDKLGLKQPSNDIAMKPEDAAAKAAEEERVAAETKAAEEAAAAKASATTTPVAAASEESNSSSSSSSTSNTRTKSQWIENVNIILYVEQKSNITEQTQQLYF